MKKLGLASEFPLTGAHSIDMFVLVCAMTASK